MVQQLNFEHFQVEDEENGEILSLSGRDAVLEDATRDDVIERSKKRFRAVNLAGLFAQAREKGINQDSVPRPMSCRNPRVAVRITPAKAAPTATIPISSTLIRSSNSVCPFSHDAKKEPT